MTPRLLLHTCCAPCSTEVIKRLKRNYDLILLFSNQNIYPEEEYKQRLENTEKITRILKLKLIEDKYCHKEWLNMIRGFENEPENGKRCEYCYRFRLEKTAKKAHELNINLITTTLTISPYKNTEIINKIGQEIAKQYNIRFLSENFKKQDGFKKSIELSKRYALYRQNYCGCEFSK
jgi:hypothetical protein